MFFIWNTVWYLWDFVVYVGPRSGSLKREAYADWRRDFRF